MNLLSFAGLLIALTSLGLGVLVLLRNPNKKMAATWFMFALASACYGTGVLLVGYAKSPGEAIQLWRLTYIFSVIWIAPLFYHFVCLFLGLKRTRSILIQYAVGLFFVTQVESAAFINRVEWLFDSLFYIRAGWFYGVFFFWWMALVGFSHWDMARVYPASSMAKKNQIKYFFLATAVGYTGGMFTYLPKFGLDIYPWGIFLVCLYPLIVGYAILKYNLMDIRIFIRRTGLFIAIYSVLLLGVGPLLISLHAILADGGAGATLSPWVHIAGVTAVLSLGPFLYAFVVRQNAFFQENRAAGLTHELKSPLAAIQGALDFLKTRADAGPIDPKLEEYLAIIDRNSERLNLFVNDLLQVFKIQNRAKPLLEERTDIRLIAERLIDLYEPLAKFKGNALEFICTEKEAVATCDAQKIETVISNLLSNAVKFTVTGAITLSLEKTEDRWTISVSDTGSGISKGDLPSVFDPFFQGTGRRDNKGAGIGLAIAKAWVEAHGGKIWAESEGEVGRGATISFTLPAK